MRAIFLSGFLLLTACTQGEQTLLFECNEQNQGEACNKLGKARSEEEALQFFRKGCKLENTNSCVSLADATSDKQEALTVLKYACDRGNTRACAKFAALSVQLKYESH
jgi:TPR repeat protein